MKNTIIIAAGYAALLMLATTLATVPVKAQSAAPQQPKAALPCSGGIWTPAPVQQAQSGDPVTPAFHAVWGLSCAGNVYMIRFGNRIGGDKIVVDILGKAPVACSGGIWTPTPVQHVQSGDPVTPAFHTVWGLSCGGNVYMVRFGNKIGPQANRIVVDVIGQVPVQ